MKIADLKKEIDRDIRAEFLNIFKFTNLSYGKDNLNTQIIDYQNLQRENATNEIIQK
ncbi:hypothetical protein [Pedobacter frigidisoli]|uniref:hypothetical protein n=1 Tax=Pedobacter frigidisoli TaxID=2530455 RepID=UPI0013F153A9|nr:hypothetical protein [Pedobacter frigidisoli]